MNVENIQPRLAPQEQLRSHFGRPRIANVSLEPHHREASQIALVDLEPSHEVKCTFGLPCEVFDGFLGRCLGCGFRRKRLLVVLGWEYGGKNALVIHGCSACAPQEHVRRRWQLVGAIWSEFVALVGYTLRNHHTLHHAMYTHFMDEIPGCQIHLTEKLHLMQELGYSDIYMHEMSSAIFRYRNADDSDAQSDLDLLDVIATCLTTGKPGDIVAAAFDKREHVSLVLAKSGNVDSADYAATHAFLSALREARDWVDLLPFLATHSKQNVDKRVRNLHESITDLCDELKSAATNNYTFDSMEVEFPRLRRYCKAKYPEEPPTPQSFLDDLIHSCVISSTDFDLQVDTSSRRQYVQLVGAADALRHSAFLWYLASKHFKGGDSKFKGRVERLRRRLGRVCQYAKINMLIKLVTRLPNIPFRWVEDVVGAGEESLEICEDVMEVVGQVLSHSSSPRQPDMLLRRCPDLRRNWEQRRFVNLCIHPEIRIVLHLSLPLLSGHLSPQHNSTYLPIGCSKTSCLCCMLWIESFNKLTGTLWVTSGSHGKPYANWALPTIAVKTKWVQRDFDTSVTDGVHWRLYNKLLPLFIRNTSLD